MGPASRNVAESRGLAELVAFESILPQGATKASDEGRSRFIDGCLGR